MATRVLLVGGGAREHAIGAALCRNPSVELYTIAHNENPGLLRLSREFKRASETDLAAITAWAAQCRVDLAVIGLEDPLKVGLVDALSERGVPTVGPDSFAARLETSKLFTRRLMQEHNIPGQVEFHYFQDADAFSRFLSSSDLEYALKPVGLTGGQGVKVMGVQLRSLDDALAYGRRVIEDQVGGPEGLVVEERLVGHEFTLQCFVDGKTVVPMPLVRDYKRAYDGEMGPNTGSKGAYSQADGLLPFVDAARRDEALEIVSRLTQAIAAEGHTYRGIMYGQFMRTQKGIQLIEVNARFGDPEAVNVLALLEDDLLSICQAVVEGTLDKEPIRFAQRASVCTYVTPPGYGETPRTDVPLKLNVTEIERLGVRVLFAKVSERDGCYLTTTSRSIALLALSESVESAADAVERALRFVEGEFHARHDIGCEYEGASPRRRALVSAE